ncbi:hypothetical protein WCLP8_670017 [uncultured Gammaproteobacteria bacterium]
MTLKQGWNVLDAFGTSSALLISRLKTAFGDRSFPPLPARVIEMTATPGKVVAGNSGVPWAEKNDKVRT